MLSSSSPLPSAAHVADVGAEELNGLSILLPSKRKGGKLYIGTSMPFVGCAQSQKLFFQLKSPSRGTL
jgi:hypothetical protein